MTSDDGFMPDDNNEVCSKAKDGKHLLSQVTIEICKEIPPGGWEDSILVDVWCSLCGCIGFTRITLDQVQW